MLKKENTKKLHWTLESRKLRGLNYFPFRLFSDAQLSRKLQKTWNVAFCSPSRCDGSSGNMVHFLPSYSCTSHMDAEATFSCEGSSCRAPNRPKKSWFRALIFTVQLLIAVLHLSDASLRAFLVSSCWFRSSRCWTRLSDSSEFLFWAVFLQLVSSGL